MDDEFTVRATKALLKLDPMVRSRIYAKVKAYAQDPATQANNVTPLKRRDGYRLRVGDYRVLFRIDDGTPPTMVVFKVAHRREAYDD